MMLSEMRDTAFFLTAASMNSWADVLTVLIVLSDQNCAGHPWICENGVAPDRALDPAVLSRLKQFSAMNRLKKMALRV